MSFRNPNSGDLDSPHGSFLSGSAASGAGGTRAVGFLCGRGASLSAACTLARLRSTADRVMGALAILTVAYLVLVYDVKRWFFKRYHTAE
jgi:hypothetical protein